MELLLDPLSKLVYVIDELPTCLILADCCWYLVFMMMMVVVYERFGYKAAQSDLADGHKENHTD